MSELKGPYDPDPEKFGPGKLAVIAGIGAGVGFGTCGLSGMAANGVGFFDTLALLGGLLFLISLVSLVVALIWAIVREATRR